MKKILLILLMFSSYQIAVAQCNPYYFLKENGKWEMTIYNKKGKVDGKQVNEVKSWEKGANGWDAVIKMAYFNKKDKLQHEGEFEMGCIDGSINFNMERFIPQESMQGFKDMNMKMTGENLTLPDNLSVGQELPPASLKMSGDMPMSMEVTIFDRKVESLETITVPAGTFECYKITYKMKMKSIISMETSGVEYVAEKVGVVKQETYSKNGKLTGYSELSSYSL